MKTHLLRPSFCHFGRYRLRHLTPGLVTGLSKKKLPSRFNLAVEAGLADKFPDLGGQIRRSEKPVIAEERGMLPIERFEFVQAMWSDIADTGQPALGKFHPVWVDIPGLHETARLLRASARIRGVDQTALLIHELIEVSPCSREELPKIIR